MKSEMLRKAIGDIDDDLIEKADKKREKRSAAPVFVKWIIPAAALILIIAAVIALPAMIKGKDPVASSGEEESAGEKSGKYKKYGIIGGSENAVIFPWEYLPPDERYRTVSLDGVIYSCRGRAVCKELVGERISAVTGYGYDVYAEKSYTKEFEACFIKGVDSRYLIAVDLDGEYFVYLCNDNAKDLSASVCEFADLVSISGTAVLDEFYSYDGNDMRGCYKTGSGKTILSMISGLSSAPCVINERAQSSSGKRISFTLTSEALGVYKKAFTVTEDGYIYTNIFEYGYEFEIGREAAAKIIAEAEKDAKETDPEPYYRTIAGRLTEIGEGYILVDDTALCKKPSDGEVFRIDTSDIIVRRYIEFPGDISTGDLVVVEYTGAVDRENGNTVEGALTVHRAVLTENGAVYNE